MTNVEELSVSRLDELAPLWRELNEHHRNSSPQFASFYATRMWHERREEFAQKAAEGVLCAFVVRDDAAVPCAYCVASVASSGKGELDSLFVAAYLRGQGIGRGLVEAALSWMRDQGARQMRVEVYAGNERAIGLYRQFGFEPRKTVMER